ncbi:hypothetical protein D3C80_1813580 [compost metagenome]
MNRDKADLLCHAFYPAGIAANLQHIAFVQHYAVIDRHFNLAADHAVEEATMIGQFQLAQALAYRIAVFDHDLFGHDAHIQQIPVEHFLTVTEARIQACVSIRVADQ